MTYREIVEAWNAQADEYNQWDNLCEEEKIEFAISLDDLTPVESIVDNLHNP